MGTDIYLRWDGMTEEDKKNQYTGYKITAGNVGYLRAFIGMIDENKVLRLIFPDEFWSGDGELPYDFVQYIDDVRMILKDYLIGIPLDDVGRGAAQRELGENITEFFNNLGVAVDSHVDVNRIDWAISVYAFIKLGVKLQQDGKNPKVDISW
jgi:hypothetical protein